MEGAFSENGSSGSFEGNHQELQTEGSILLFSIICSLLAFSNYLAIVIQFQCKSCSPSCSNWILTYESAIHGMRSNFPNSWFTIFAYRTRKEWKLKLMLLAKHSSGMQTSTARRYQENYHMAMVALKVWPLLLLHWLLVLPSCPQTWNPGIGRNCLYLLALNSLSEEDAVWLSTNIGAKHRFVFRIPAFLNFALLINRERAKISMTFRIPFWWYTYSMRTWETFWKVSFPSNKLIKTSFVWYFDFEVLWTKSYYMLRIFEVLEENEVQTSK